MGQATEPSGQLQVDSLQERILWLEEELACSRRALEALQTGEEKKAQAEVMLLSGRGEGEGTPPRAEGEGEICFLAPLLPHEEVSIRWRLGEGLQEPRPRAAQGTARSTPGPPLSGVSGESTLRLFGLLPSGQPWKCSIPFADLARPGGVVLGRSSEESDVVLNEGSVSRRHARLELDDQGLVITDEESTNGVCVDGCRLSPYERRAVLSDGITVTIGEVVLRVEIILASSTHPI